MTRWLWVWVVFGCACGADTEGQSIGIRWSVEAADRADADRDFVTDTGWEVHLEEARVAVESVFAIAPEKDQVGAVARLTRLLVPVARAHGGHDDATGRRIRAEWLDPFVVDLLADSRATLGEYSGEAGEVSDVTLELARAKERLPESLYGFAAYVRGTAERDGAVVRFAGGLTFADDEPARRVELPVRITLAEGGLLTLDVHGSEWLREAEFDRLAEAGSPDAEREITPQTQVGRAWAIGARSPAAFRLSWKPAKD